MILLVDIGNSRIKWAIYHKEQFRFGGATSYTNGLTASLFLKLWAELPRPEHIWISSVVGEKTHWILKRWTHQRWQRTAQFAKTTSTFAGLSNAYDSPEQLGVDRWLGLAKIWQAHQSAFCLISAGTAMTVDVVNAQGQHQGGYIIPGLNMMQDILVSNTFGCCLDPARALSEQQALANNTHDAITAGTQVLFSGFLKAVKDTLHTQFETLPTIWITGGNAKQVEHLWKGPIVLQPDLVLLGLLAWGKALKKPKKVQKQL